MAQEVKQPTRWDLFRILCKVLGGQDIQALAECVTTGKFPQLVETAQSQDMLPALAVRCNEQFAGKLAVSPESELLTGALRDNTMRNMQISAQALKLTKQLNKEGITPLFLKGTAELLAATTENLGFRKQVDIDFLVEPKHLEAAAEILLGDGYYFYQFSSNPTIEPIKISDTRTAIKRSAAHHHLPPLVKKNYATTVELHRHFLPSRFQNRNPLKPLFSTAIPQESHDAKYLIPSLEYQIIHLILGKLLHDGHLARRTMPLREACDYIHLVKSARESINTDLVEKHCGKDYTLFTQLASKLMLLTSNAPNDTRNGTERYMRTMQARFDSPTFCTLLDAYARVSHLSNSLVHSPAKLPAYISRVITAD